MDGLNPDQFTTPIDLIVSPKETVTVVVRSLGEPCPVLVSRTRAIVVVVASSGFAPPWNDMFPSPQPSSTMIPQRCTLFPFRSNLCNNCSRSFCW